MDHSKVTKESVIFFRGQHARGEDDTPAGPIIYCKKNLADDHE